MGHMNTTHTTNHTDLPTMPCMICSGTGSSPFGDDCAKCNGTGRTPTARTGGTRHQDDTYPRTRGNRRTTSSLATDKQVAFLAKLINERVIGEAGTVTEDSLRTMTKAEASAAIEAALATPRPARTTRTAPAAPATTEVTDGFWTDGTSVAKVQYNLAGTSLYGKLLDTDSGKWNYTAGMPNRIRRDGWTKLSLEQAKDLGVLYGRCCCCGRRLTDDSEGGSISKGIGPVCESKYFG